MGNLKRDIDIIVKFIYHPRKMNSLESMETKVEEVNFWYKAKFSPPILKLAESEHLHAFLGNLINYFGLSVRDIMINQIDLSSRYISFRRLLPGSGIYDVFIGLDEVSIYFFNPAQEGLIWDYSTWVLESLSKQVELTFESQRLNIELHLSVKKGDSAKFFNIISPFTLQDMANEAKGKGIIIHFDGPKKGSVSTFIISSSTQVPDGIYLSLQSIFGKEITSFKDLYADTKSFLLDRICKEFNLTIGYQK